MTGKITVYHLTAGIVLALALMAAPVAAAHMTEYLNTNLPGSDYKTVAEPSGMGCALVCMNDNNCQAATWVSRAGQEPFCSLKNAIPVKTPFAGNETVVMHSYIKNMTGKTPAAPLCTPVQASFTADKTSGPVPLTVHFIDTTIGAAETIWTWGDGLQVHASPQSEVDHTYMQPGMYTVNLTVSDECGFSSMTRTILVNDGEAMEYGNLRVDSVPEGASVSIDGYPVGITPVRLMADITEGVHRIRISMAGYDEYIDDVTIHSGQIFELKVVLTKRTVNGVSQTSPLPAATVASTYNAADSTLKKALKDLQPGQTAIGNTAAGMGVLIVSSNPAGANVYLDGMIQGNTPLTISNVTAGQHSLLLTRQGYTDNSQTVTISGGYENPVAVSMTAAKKTPGFEGVAGCLCIALLVLFRKRSR